MASTNCGPTLDRFLYRGAVREFLPFAVEDSWLTHAERFLSLSEKYRTQTGLGVESSVHRRMKGIIREELERDGYSVVEEPLYPLAGWISWSAYRPDLLGFREQPLKEEVAVVECETHPSMNRFRSKNYLSLWFQPSLLRDGSIRRILAVPRGKLGNVDLRLRDSWEIWVLGEKGPMERLPCLGRTSAL